MSPATIAPAIDAPGVEELKRNLQESEVRRRALLDSALDCVFCTDDQARITDLNATAERTFRIRRAVILGRDLTQVILPLASRDRYRRELFASSISPGIDVIGSRLETIAVRADGSEFPAEFTVSSVLLDKKANFTVHIRDISARKRAEEAVVWLASIVESTQDAIVGIDLQERITSWNRGAERMYGYLAEEVVGKNISILIPPERAYEDLKVAGERKIGRRIQMVETVRVTKGGKRLDVALTLSPVLDSDGEAIGASVISRDITARKMAEEALRKANETNVYASPVPIVAGDLKFRITTWNPAAEKLFGWKEQEVLGKPNPIIPEDGLAEVQALNEQVLAGHTITGVEVRRRKRDGSMVDISMSAAPLWDENRKVKGLIAFLTDITERKRSEQAIRVAEEKYREIFEKAIIGIFQSTPQGRYISVNPALAQMMGYDSPQGMLENVTSISEQVYVHKKDRDAFVRILEETGIVQNFECQAYRKDRSIMWLSTSARATYEGGKLVRIDGMNVDITQRKLLEEAVRATEEKYRQIFEKAIMGIFQSTPEGRYISVNPELARMLGYSSPQEMLSTITSISDQIYVHKEDRKEFIEMLTETGVVQDFECQSRRKDGSIVWLSWNARATFENGKLVRIDGMNQDITERKLLEEQLQQAQKMEAIGLLAGGVAHDFNNILMAVSSYAELLQSKIPERESNRKYVDEIAKAVDRAASLTQGLLAFGRKQVISPRVVDLNLLISDQIKMLSRLIPENIELTFEPTNDSGRVRVDPGQMEQVVANLIINARDAMPDGGQILIEISRAARGPAKSLNRNLPPAEGYILLSVRDNGQGMDAVTKARIFEPFFTTKAQGKGTGLGLAIVFGIVDQSAGHIAVESEPGRGTVFQIYLPRVEEALQTPRLDEDVANYTGDETILLVEDEPALRDAAAYFLAENGYNVLEAEDGKAALEITRTYHQRIDLMISDVVMPHMSGRELADQLAQTRPDTQVLFMSGYSSNMLSSDQVLHEGHELLQKPFRLTTLGQRIREILARKKSSAAHA